MSYDDEDSRQADIFIQKVLGDAMAYGTNVIHIEPIGDWTRARFRLQGMLRTTMQVKGHHNSVLAMIKALADIHYDKFLPPDGVLKFHEADFVVSVIPGSAGEKVVLRRVNDWSELKDINELGMEDEQLAQFQNAIHQRRGVVLLAGPTRSGKNTTIYAALNELNHSDRNIATTEIVERGRLPGVHHTTIKEEIGITFASAMRSFMRSDVDIAYVREIYDLETIQLIMKAALQHDMLVFSTVHTIDTASTFDRLINMGIEPWIMAESVVLAQAQRLLRKLCPQCKEKAEVPPEVLVKAGLPHAQATTATVYKPVGCTACYETGYLDNILVCETMPPRVGLGKELSSWSHEDIKKVSIERGMRTLRMTALSRMCEGLTSLDEVLLMTPPDSDVRT